MSTSYVSGHGSDLQLGCFLPDQIVTLGRSVSRTLNNIYARYDLQLNEWRVLAALAEGGEQTATSVGLASKIHKTKVSRAVFVLEKRKLITRRNDTRDFRRTILSLTPAGGALFRETIPLALQFAKELEAAIPPANRAAFEQCLQGLQERASALAVTRSAFRGDRNSS